MSERQAQKKLNFLLDPEHLPTRKDENYRYTSIRGLKLDRFPRAEKRSKPIPASILKLSPEEKVVVFQESSSKKIKLLKKSSKVKAGELKELQKKQPEWFKKIKRQLKIDPQFENDVFSNLAVARTLNPLVIYIPDHTDLDGTIRISHYFDSNSDVFFAKTWLILGKASKAFLVEEFMGSGSSKKDPFFSALTQVVGLKNSTLHYTQLQNLGKKVRSFTRQSLQVESHVDCEFVSCGLGGTQAQSRTEIHCAGRGSQVRVFGCNRGDENQSFDTWVTSRHSVSDTQCHMKHWNVAADQSRSVFNGNIIISQKGVRTHATQHNKNMILSSKAVANAIPKLEIATDEVQCAHGATIVPVSEDQVYYLCSRGISEEEAKKMIIDGFTEEVVKRIPTQSARTKVHRNLRHKHGLEDGYDS